MTIQNKVCKFIGSYRFCIEACHQQQLPLPPEETRENPIPNRIRKCSRGPISLEHMNIYSNIWYPTKDLNLKQNLLYNNQPESNITPCQKKSSRETHVLSCYWVKASDKRGKRGRGSAQGPRKNQKRKKKLERLRENMIERKNFMQVCE